MDTTYKKECSICGNLTYWSSIEGYDEYIKSSNWCKKFICRRCKEDVLLKNFNLKIIKYMTNEQIFKTAITIAVKNGYRVTTSDAISSIISENEPSIEREEELNGFSRVIIFSHDFAKAFWGEGPADEQYNLIDKYWQEDDDSGLSGFYFQGDRWQYHLQQMVLEKEPIKYLEQFIK